VQQSAKVPPQFNNTSILLLTVLGIFKLVATMTETQTLVKITIWLSRVLMFLETQKSLASVTTNLT
jgi:hypothetical protein